MIVLRDVSIEKNGKFILKNVNFTWRKGERIALLGRNGCGKTTLASVIAGLIAPSRGEVIMEGRVGIVFQEPETQFVTLNCEEEISFGLENMGLSREEVEERIEKVKEKLGIEPFFSRNPFTLSGGELQIMAVASILVMEPDFLIFDEATSFLDAEWKRKVYKVWEEYPGGIMIITQDFSEVVYAEKVYVMEEGKIVYEGKTEEMLERGLLRTDEVLFVSFLKEMGIEINAWRRDEILKGVVNAYTQGSGGLQK